MMIVRAFTGPSKGLQDRAVEFVRHVIREELVAPHEVRTGAAPGVDTIAAYAALHAWPLAHHRIFVPRAPYNAWVLSLPTDFVYCYDGGSDRAAAYRARNERMVRGATELCAFVWGQDFYRSGEWMTINIARRAGVPVRLFQFPTAEV